MTETKHPNGHDLQAFFDNEMNSAVAEVVADHVDTCETCRAVLAELDKVCDTMADIPAPELPHTVWNRVEATRRQHDAPLGRAFKLALTAACAAGIVLGLRFGPVKFRTEVRSEEQHGMALESVWGSDSGFSLLAVYTPAGE